MSDELKTRLRTVEAQLRQARAQLARVGVEAREAPLKPGPIFVGGTGRSGTWMMGRLVGQDPDIVCIRTELQFHATHGGLRDVLDGDETPRAFTDRVYERWDNHRTGAGGRAKGLFIIATGSEVKQAGQHFLRLADGDLASALSTYVHELVDPYALGRGATRWVETSPPNATHFDVFSRVFPNARMINMVRDGRDVAASVLKFSWGPSTWDEALTWWETRIRDADRAIAATDPERVLTIRLEEMVHLTRERDLTAVVELVEADHPRRMRGYFDRAVNPDAAHVGRWRHETEPEMGAQLDRDYRRRYEAMASDGVSTLPLSADMVDELAK